MEAAVRTAEAQIVDALRVARIVPVATIEDPEIAVGLCEALKRGGLPCIEIAFRSARAAAALREAAAVDGMLVGAGTVLDPEQAEAALTAGARFAVSPGTNREVVRHARGIGLPFFPGVATPSEIETARSLGLATVKVFPAGVLGGVAFLRAVSATYPDVSFIPTGGIDAVSARDYLALDSVVACGGSWLVAPALLADRRFDEVERLAREVVELAA